jgi:hypothetical protein
LRSEIILGLPGVVPGSFNGVRLVGLIHARRDPIGIYSGKAGKYSGRGWRKPEAASPGGE